MLPEPHAGRATGAGDGDRLSALPDDILRVVLSILPARQAVQTTVLSPRWSGLWRSAPRVAVDEREFGVSHSRRPREKWGRFESFATNLLASRCGSAPLDRFRLYAHGHVAPVDEWIQRGIECRPAALEIQTPYYPVEGHEFDPPHFAFPHLGSGFYGRLKTLRLVDVELDASFSELLSSDCPALVDLELVGCANHFRRIASSTLEKLVIDSCYDCDDSGQPMLVVAPSLTTFKLHTANEGWSFGISVCDAASLVKASISTEGSCCFPVNYLCKLLAGLSSVKTLELEGFDNLVTKLDSDKLPMFPNMRALSLERCYIEDYDPHNMLEDLGRFLENALCLEKLTLRSCAHQSTMSVWKVFPLPKAEADRTQVQQR
ncbi:hypothetical protein SETIT_1G163700v2 [Setaria italica]|uniref:F-box domain-containing protein n=1 Tax=Setaria italica TaxID=4555 RepID=A0A368PLT3_SETIT|nr:hypothetical protein SETIT_1G163700v2 [Setaria italica]